MTTLLGYDTMAMIQLCRASVGYWLPNNGVAFKSIIFKVQVERDTYQKQN